MNSLLCLQMQTAIQPPWTPEEKVDLIIGFRSGCTIVQLAKRLNRSEAAVLTRLKRLRLLVQLGSMWYRLEATPYWEAN